LVAVWAKEYLKSENPALVVFILNYLTEWAQMQGDPVYRASSRLESVARDPAMLLPRPGHRVGRERYTSALDRHRHADDTATAGRRVWNHAEAWIKVRHKLVKSLAECVRETEARPYTMSDGEDSYGGEYDGRYKRTWKNLKAIDKAIEAIG
jgi:Txe/YoeB family toxin of Txe-Axe toxin-antitoxin module